MFVVNSEFCKRVWETNHEVLTCWGAVSAGEKLDRAFKGTREAHEDALEGGGV